MIVRYAGAPTVGAGFLDYLASRLHVHDLQFAEQPTLIPDGWETYIYRFRLCSRQRLPAEFARPLILRVYSSMAGLPRLRREVSAQRFLCRLGYPVPRPLLVQKDDELFGGPFAVLEFLRGRTLLNQLLRYPWLVFHVPARLAREHVRLHRLSADGFPAAPGDFLDRRLTELGEQIETYDLQALAPGLDWLHQHRPPPPERPCVLHMDFHPLNVLFVGGRCTGVVDWCEADVGDRHADVATTLLLMRTVPIPVPAYLQPVSGLGRWIQHFRYRNVYGRRLRLDRGRLSYYLALAALRRLGRWGAWARATPRVTGSKLSAMQCVQPAQVAAVEHCFRRATGVNVRL